ncbi:ankyrin repeat and MYND domain-containing protein 1 isoform X2 [Hemibagrus wyckioides]|uniref:ankyrin repeat and MYND domain-containing protein 1 isoform X2 n=1 Tax=Hemibagrus wyckioides TaxID=337641 RepID=UPI00266B73E4|nr:ankyrin repeat and MYND domain-containing protein 1 isoform X2 [Hemibagrus wyckioides]
MMKTGFCEINGPGVQEWTDGSRYEGEFLNGLKHGNGTFTWPNGECYKGSFYKDYRHGKGTYFWPDGSQFIGKFYLNRKEGYGVHHYPDGTIFEGLYHANERFGPGVMSYPDACQDVGLWYRQWLLRLCTTVQGGFTLTDFPEHMARLPQQHLNQIQSLPSFTMGSCIEGNHFLTIDAYLLGDSSHRENEKFILPPGIESYSTDSDHLPIPQSLRQELDLHFFNRSNISMPLFSNRLPLQQRMEAQIQAHSFEVEELNWNVADVLAMNRDHFGPKGPLELRSESFIKEASLGDLQNIQSILRDGKVHPDVCDMQGHTALIAATVNCHDDVINLLLDSGADVNKLNHEGMSALAVCSVLYYPLQSLQETVAEKTYEDITTKPEISEPLTLTNSSQGATAEERPKDEVDTELPDTDSQINQVKSEECSTTQKSDTPKHKEEIKSPRKDEEVPQQTPNGQGLVVEVELLKEPEPLKSGMLGDTSACRQDEDEGKNVFSTDKDSKTDRNISPGRDPGFDLASPVDSFHINTPEAIMAQIDEVLSETGQVSPAQTRETVNRIAIMKTENEAHWATMKLLLERGADPNVSSIPMPVIFLAIKAGHVEAVQRLLECGACTDLHLTAEQKGLYPLHVAAGLTGPVGPKITELLLHAVADPDVKAQDGSEVYVLDKERVDGGNMSSLGSETCINTTSIDAPKEGGRTPLHVACQRDTDYANARDVVSILLSHKASTNHLWSGHSPLSLAIASGNDLAVDELLGAGADPNLPLTCQVGSALCAAANIHYNSGPRLRNRIKLVEKLIKAGANILMPVVVGERGRSAIGTAVDYAYYMFNKDWRIAHIPYHALKQQEREAYNARRQLITMMAELMRQAATSMEKQRWENEKSQGIHRVSPTDKFVFTGTGATPPADRTRAVEEQRESVNKSTVQKRKPLFKYCYQCGRSAWVALTPCSRCHEVFYCSKACKLKAWNERHKEECLRVPGSGRPEGSHMSGGQRCLLSSKSSRKGNNQNFKLDKPNSSKAESHTFTHQHNPEENYSFI